MEEFDIKLNHTRRLLLVEVRGFWSVDVTAAYFADLAPLLSDIRRTGQTYDVLSDMTEWQVQSREVQSTIQTYFERPWPGRRAFVVSGALLRLQVARVVPSIVRDPDVKIFETRNDGLAWLEAGRATPMVATPA